MDVQPSKDIFRVNWRGTEHGMIYLPRRIQKSMSLPVSGDSILIIPLSRTKSRPGGIDPIANKEIPD